MSTIENEADRRWLHWAHERMATEGVPPEKQPEHLEYLREQSTYGILRRSYLIDEVAIERAREYLAQAS